MVIVCVVLLYSFLCLFLLTSATCQEEGAALAQELEPLLGWMHMVGPLRCLLIPGTPISDIALYIPHAEHFGDVDLSVLCVRCSFGRILRHDIDLKGLSTWDFLRLGMPVDTPVDSPFPPDSYFWDITHDEDHILFGGPYGSPSQCAAKRVVSQILKDSEAEELQLLLESIEDIEELIHDGDDDVGDRQEWDQYTLWVTWLTKVAWNRDNYLACSIH
jgi:hypothetical protein